MTAQEMAIQFLLENISLRPEFKLLLPAIRDSKSVELGVIHLPTADSEDALDEQFTLLQRLLGDFYTLYIEEPAGRFIHVKYDPQYFVPKEKPARTPKGIMGDAEDLVDQLIELHKEAWEFEPGYGLLKKCIAELLAEVK